MGGKKLFFFDIDGTLIPEDTYCLPSPAVCGALSALRAEGHKIFLCTGRPVCDIGPELMGMELDGIVAGAGAYISLGGKCLFHKSIPLPLLRETVDRLIRCRVSGLLDGTHSLYYAGRGSRVMHWDFPRIERAEDLTGEESIEKFTVRVSYPEEFAPLREYLSLHYEIYASDDGLFYEMAQRGWDKASAMRRLCEHFGMGLEDTVAFGDSRNDLLILRTAGTGVAMAQAPEDGRQAAQLVTGTVEEDGVYSALRCLGFVS